MATVVSYLHPHMETRINDNSTVVDYSSTSGTVTFMPYFSDRGVDGVIERYTSYSQFIADKGIPNFKKHGQSIYNVLQFLRGGGVVYAMRLLPTNAVRANVALGVRTSSEGADGETVYASTEPINDEALTDTLAKVLENKLTGEDKLVQFLCKGRGVYGNKYTVDLIFNKQLTESYAFSIYELTVKESGKIIEGPYYVSLQPEAVNIAGASMFVRNVLEEYSSSIAVRFNEDLYDATILGLTDVEAPYEEDLLGLAASGVSLDLAEGTDGSFPEAGEGQVQESNDTLLAAAFNNTALQSKTHYPIDILLDANFSESVKKAIYNLAKARGDVFTILDLGPEKVSSPDMAIENKDGLDIEDDRTVAFYAQTFTVFDSFTNSDIVVTMPYFLAYKIPANDNQYGIQYAIAGPTRGVIAGFKSMSFNPTADGKEELYKNRINYAEQDYRSTKLMSQLTSQKAASALSNINNMRVLLRMVREVEQISENYFFEFASESTLTHFEAAINTYLSDWVNNGACQVCQGVVYQNDYDVVQRIVRVSIEVVFTGLIERIVIEFNVGSNAA